MNTLLKGRSPVPDAETHGMWGCKLVAGAGAALEKGVSKGNGCGGA